MKPKIRWSLLAALIGMTLAGVGRAQPPVAYPTVGAGQTVSPRMFGLIVHLPRAEAWPSIRFGFARLWDTRTDWRNLEPAEGKWNFSDLDKFVALAQQHNVQLILTLGNTPQWASMRPDEPCLYGMGCGAEPKDPKLWEDYVRTVVQRYKGKIAYYEIWNEPAFAMGQRHDHHEVRKRAAFFSGDPQDMVALARSAKSVINEVDPAARVLSPAAVAEVSRMEPFLAAGGGDTFDIWAEHFYDDQPERLPRRISEFRTLLAKYGVGDKPIWNTETGWVLNTPKGGGLDKKFIIPETTGADLVARTLILSAYFGLDRVAIYAWDDNLMPLSELGTDQPNGVGKAYDRVASWLTGATLGDCGRASQQIWRCALTRNGRAAELMWSTQPDQALTVPAAFAPGATIETLDGAAPGYSKGPFQLVLGPSPILVTYPASRIAKSRAGRRPTTQRWGRRAN
jgi:hypothetical protein